MRGAHVYQVTEEVMRDILKLPGISEDFKRDCNEIAEKYRKKIYTKEEMDRLIESNR